MRDCCSLSTESTYAIVSRERISRCQFGSKRLIRQSIKVTQKLDEGPKVGILAACSGWGMYLLFDHSRKDEQSLGWRRALALYRDHTEFELRPWGILDAYLWTPPIKQPLPDTSIYLNTCVGSKALNVLCKSACSSANALPKAHEKAPTSSMKSPSQSSLQSCVNSSTRSPCAANSPNVKTMGFIGKSL